MSRSSFLKKLQLDEWYSTKQKAEHANQVYFLTKNVNPSVRKAHEVSLLEFSHSKHEAEELYCLHTKIVPAELIMPTSESDRI